MFGIFYWLGDCDKSIRKSERKIRNQAKHFFTLGFRFISFFYSFYKKKKRVTMTSIYFFHDKDLVKVKVIHSFLVAFSFSVCWVSVSAICWQEKEWILLEELRWENGRENEFPSFLLWRKGNIWFLVMADGWLFADMHKDKDGIVV